MSLQPPPWNLRGRASLRSGAELESADKISILEHVLLSSSFNGRPSKRHSGGLTPPAPLLTFSQLLAHHARRRAIWECELKIS
jgi:hypothetical protein